MKIITFVTGIMTMIWIGNVAADQSVYETVLAGKKCTETSSQSLSCEYKVGKTLHVSIDGIGDPDTGITFMKSDFDGDFYATFGIGHGCVIVKSGLNKKGRDFAGYAFISPKNGKVYNDWQDCKSGY